MSPQELQTLLENELKDFVIQVNGDGHHFEAILISSTFIGKKPLERSRMVYNALGPRISNGTVHAFSMKTYTPEEWQGRLLEER
jgi:acid stress-induced BolA-like protein IbaG/YrbA